MAIIVFDDFNRADDPTSLGTASTGQVWSQIGGVANEWGINSNTAFWSFTFEGGAGVAVIETGFTDAITKVTLVNPTNATQNFAVGVGLISRYVDNNFYWRLAWFRFPGPTNQLRLQRIYAGAVTTVIDLNINLSNGDTISLGCCGSNFEIFVNDVSQGTYDDSLSPQNYGTKSGLYASPGSFFAGYNENYDDFTVETNASCTPTYDCTEAGCVDPGDGTGTYATLEECLTACDVEVSYNCVDGTCTDPGDGSGEFSTLLECQNSGCGIPTTTGIGTERFDAGNGTSWYVVPQLSDSGDELRSKNLKSGYVIGKVTNASIQGYGFDINQEINPDEIAAGDRLPNSTSAQSIPDSEQVTQSPRKQINVKNATNTTVRVAGDCTGEEVMDRVDQIGLELSEQGVRR